MVVQRSARVRLPPVSPSRTNARRLPNRDRSRGLRSIQLPAGSGVRVRSPVISPMPRKHEPDPVGVLVGADLARRCRRRGSAGTGSARGLSADRGGDDLEVVLRRSGPVPEAPRTRNAVASRSGGGPPGWPRPGRPRALRLIRTVMLLRRCAIRLPTRGAPKRVSPTPRDSSARRVASIVPLASTTAQPPGTGSVSRMPLLDTSMLVTVPPVMFSRSTWVRGTRKIRRVTSPRVVVFASSRVALMIAGALEYLSKANRPEAGADPWTASGCLLDRGDQPGQPGSRRVAAWCAACRGTAWRT